MALQLKTPPAPAASPYTKGALHSTPACRPNDLGTVVKRAVKRPLGKSSKDAGKAVAEEIIADITARHTISEGGSKKFLDVKKQLAAVGMHIHKTVADSGDDKEVRVVPHKDRHNKDLGYFTDDLDDALHSGLHIAKTIKESAFIDLVDPKALAKELSLGGVHRIGDHVSITQEHGAYLVKRHPSHPAGHYIKGHRTLSLALKDGHDRAQQ